LLPCSQSWFWNIAEFSKAAKNRNEILDEYQELFDRYLEEKEDE